MADSGFLIMKLSEGNKGEKVPLSFLKGMSISHMLFKTWKMMDASISILV